jgi:hypothetical protein
MPSRPASRFPRCDGSNRGCDDVAVLASAVGLARASPVAATSQNPEKPCTCPHRCLPPDDRSGLYYPISINGGPGLGRRSHPLPPRTQLRVAGPAQQRQLPRRPALQDRPAGDDRGNARCPARPSTSTGWQPTSRGTTPTLISGRADALPAHGRNPRRSTRRNARGSKGA